ncbi:MAG: monovalent cation/H(+) antiporter subunit G [Candidatus Thermoplasmatota archaeon]|nr:monovalent cation/H(+) antiporter subunit G [Candidatus Thermoplasmatota archaeon]
MITILVLIIISGIFSLLGAIGLHRFPDVYTRLHAATKTTTFGSIFLAIAVIVYSIFRITEVGPENDGAFITLAAHTFIALLAILITNPTGAHAIARAARKTGIAPEQAVIDEYEEVD